MPYRIVCPYCFREFTDTQTVFRATRGFTESSVFALSGTEREECMPYMQFDEYDGDLSSIPRNLRVDESLVEFWQERGGLAGYQTDDPMWYMPHIDPTHKKAFNQMITKESVGGLKPDPDGFVRDRDGFAYRVIDRFERVADTPLTRLCPHCHNSLPLADYGKYPVVFIGITGMSSAGKTVYLRQLLASMPAFMKNSGYHIGASGMVVEGLRGGEELPESTDVTVMRRPQAVHLVADDSVEGEGRNFTLVFYDIAGENCVDSPDDTPERRKMKQAIAGYIGHLDALLFLVDPDQIPYFSARESAKDRSIQSVSNLVHNVVNLRARNIDSPTWDNVPVAVVLAKSDLPGVRGRIESVIKQPLTPVGTTDGEGHEYRGFARDEFKPINTRLHETFRTQIAPVEGELASFKIRGYFAVSALNDGVTNRIRMYRNTYRLDGDVAQAVADMKCWLQDWDIRTPEERPYFDGGTPGSSLAVCPVIQTSGGEDIVFDVSCSTNAYDDVITELTATKTAMDGRGGGLDTINLTIRDIKTLALESVPNGVKTLRIEEPLKWLLWRRGVIREPLPLWDEGPKYRAWHSKKRRAAMDQMFEEQRIAYCEQFYACEDVVGV